MKKIENGLRLINPSQGKRLTNGKIIAERTVYLGKNETAFNWYEITEEEAKEILKAQEELITEKLQ